MPRDRFDLIVIGAGPGGYVAAIRAAQLGLNVGCVEKERALGGTCLRVGCIPSKALLESSERYRDACDHLKDHGVTASGLEVSVAKMLKRKERTVKTLTAGIDGLLKKNKITRLSGTASFVSPGVLRISPADGEASEVEADKIIVATGSVSRSLPGIEIDGEGVGTSTDALSYSEVPKKLIVIGAGAIGLELGSVWGRLGAEVTVLEYLDRILPGMDLEVAKATQKILEKQGMKFELGCRVTGAKRDGDTCRVERADMDPIEGDRVLVSVGRGPNTEGLSAETIGLKLDDRGRIEVDDHFRTSVDGVYAIGDVVRGPMLAHKAEDEGVACVEGIVTGYCHVNYDAIPSVVYTHPEVASVGKTEEELKQSGIEFRKGKFPFLANGRARALGQTDGFTKILAHAETDRILGVHIVGARAGDLIAQAATAMEFGASSEDLARTCHAHPTLAETLKEAAFDVDGRMIHM